MPQLKKDDQIGLMIGTKIYFLNHEKNGANYIVESVEPTALRLVLRRLGSFTNFPEEIILNGQTSIIGRKELSSNETNKSNQHISKQHAKITWENDHCTYQHLGANPTTITPYLQTDSPEAIALEDFISLLQSRELQLNHASYLEKGSNAGFNQTLIGGKSEYSLESYSLYLQAYLALNPNTPEVFMIKKIIHIIEELKSERELLRSIEENKKYQTELSAYPNLKETSYNPILAPLIQRKIAELQQNNETYILAGFKGHLAIGKLTTHDNDSTCHYTVHNAGAEAYQTEVPGQVMGTCERKLKNPGLIENFLKIAYEKKLRSPFGANSQTYETVAREHYASLEDSTIRARLTTQQHKGNCTTRSVREMFFDLLSNETAEAIHTFVQQGPDYVITNLKASLYQLRKNKPPIQEKITNDDENNDSYNVTTELPTPSTQSYSPMWQPCLSCSGEHKRRKVNDDDSDDIHQLPNQYVY